MIHLFRWVLILLIFCLTLPVIACGSETRIVKKPEGLRKENSDPANSHLTAQDRMKWKSVLNWCDECDERSRIYRERFGTDDGLRGGIDIYPIGDNQYVVDIQCTMTMRQSEHIYYKVTEHDDTIESQLLMLDQFYFIFAEGEIYSGVEDPIKDPEGEFIRFTDTLTYGFTLIPSKHSNHLVIEKEYRGGGGCGLYTVYDISGVDPKVIEFRAKPFCSSEGPKPTEWKLYTPEQRSKWRIAPNPLRKDWKPSPSPACTK